MLHLLGPGAHIMAVCQPSVPVLAAAALMEARGDPHLPATMTLMGGPIDTRVNPTAVNTLANNHDLDWFENNVIMKVPFPHPGFMRDVYPGFLQISGFLSMNPDRHMDAHQRLLQPPGRWRRRRGRQAPRLLRRVPGGHGPDRRVLPADRRDGVPAPRAAEGRDDAPQGEGRSGGDQARSRCSRSRARTTTSPASARPRPRTTSAPDFRRTRRPTTCSRRSATTASSTARASAREIAPRIADFIATHALKASRQRRQTQGRPRLRFNRPPKIGRPPSDFA